ncbi:hypothetical protein JN01_0150 [Entomoplasma freundtii]|uniref:CAAX amino terminal membrane bound protease n=1 Tax=Entomoplasma freundtii TaxID=74700 RepID=A0A2K8NS39_9MOLU|nr:CPBP family intramembrane glutamic endopeptidase [Entomoplasma freundtii]ATZ16629.1 CAAX amino terminal membrane bound protease [Entomoplasma freundtii]TDY58204.1 hypothetical protein JN01_0150 [Entomoplasma freundtii]
MALKKIKNQTGNKPSLLTPNNDFPFSFGLYKFRFDGWLFVGLNLLVPLIALFTIRFTLGFDKTGQLIYIGLNLFCFVLSMVYFLYKDSKLFMKSGLFIFYALQIMNPLIMLTIGGLGLSLIKNDSPWRDVWTMGVQVATEIVIIIWAFRSTLDLKERVKNTFKNDLKKLLAIVAIGTIVIFGASFLYGLATKGTVLGGDSDNQNSLIGKLREPGLGIGVKITTLLLLAIFTIGVAPLAEELAIRHAWYIGCGNRTIAWLTSALFFALIHVSSGDVEHLLNYFIAGFILSTIFNLSKGNVTHSWLTHLSYNAIGYIAVVASL